MYQSLGNKIQREKDKIIKRLKELKLCIILINLLESIEYVAGVDEVGRGPLAGPIVACAVILDLNVLEDDFILEINDSKKVK